jgi:hypothetical protein
MSACASYEARYSAKSIEAWVVDADTNAPIEGVIVLANWEIRAGEWQAGSRIIHLKILETVTAQDGRFYFPSWGPEPNPSAIGYIGFNDPELILFKSGFGYMALANMVLSEPRPGPVRYSDWDGKTIKMRKAVSDTTYLDQFGSLNRLLDSRLTSPDGPCEWRRVPRMIAALMHEELRLRGKGLIGISSLTSRLKTNEEYFSRNGCGSVNTFLNNLK